MSSFKTTDQNYPVDVKVTSQNSEAYLLIDSKGVLQTKEDLFKHCQLIFDEIIKHAPQKVLINEPEMQFPPGLFSYFELVQHYIDDFPPEIADFKIAVVISEKFKEIGDFWETVCVNRGLQYFVFYSLEDATKWLLG
ncbi:MAG: hypothetical protein JWP81_3578 [Ferruginibacter sp.]|nr:hypothetical protein [Ferruginibacter sp.]